ncbi:nuclear transport factor 2 family protein [Granulicella sp. L60]|uniref:YybH family protein n=1 Tax=Granulicella sp. L60 TaxID=1641866 RepID=UPI00131AD59F|nr:nuclear transport factor 2 family protein [Granulicella sp. L60]
MTTTENSEHLETQTLAVWNRHVAAAQAGDIETVMSDFSEESVYSTPQGVLIGSSAIRGFFENLFAMLRGKPESTVVHFQTIHKDVVVCNFTIHSLGLTFHDTSVVRNGKFVLSCTVAYPAS